MDNTEKLKESSIIKEKRDNSGIIKFFIYILLLVLAFISFVPFFIMIINATHSSNEVVSKINLIPGSKLLENYNILEKNVNIWRGFLNSLIVSVCGTAVAAYLGSLAAYAFSRFDFKGKNVLFWIMMGSMMVPPQLGLIGFFDIVRRLNLYDNILALIISMFANATLVFFVKLYIDSSVPKSIIESARIDGASEFRIFNRIILPMIIPSIATMGIFVFIYSWNNFLGPLVILTSAESKTLPILIAEAKGMYNSEIASQYVAVAISVVPIMVVFSFCSKYIISGLTAGSVKE